MSNSFSAAGHIYIPGLYTGQTIEKNLSRQDCMLMVPKLFCLPAQETSWSNFAAHQPHKFIPVDGEWHYLEITTSPGNVLRKWCDVALNGADLRKKSHFFSEISNFFFGDFLFLVTHAFCGTFPVISLLLKKCLPILSVAIYLISLSDKPVHPNSG